MSGKKPEDDAVLFSGKCLNGSYKGKEFEGYLKFKTPAKKPEKKRSIWDSIWVWFFLFAGINFIAGDPMGFTKTSSIQLFCHPDDLPKSGGHKPSSHDDSSECWF